MWDNYCGIKFNKLHFRASSEFVILRAKSFLIPPTK